MKKSPHKKATTTICKGGAGNHDFSVNPRSTDDCRLLFLLFWAVNPRSTYNFDGPFLDVAIYFNQNIYSNGMLGLDSDGIPIDPCRIMNQQTYRQL